MTQCFLFKYISVKSDCKEEVANEQNIYGTAIWQQSYMWQAHDQTLRGKPRCTVISSSPWAFPGEAFRSRPSNPSLPPLSWTLLPFGSQRVSPWEAFTRCPCLACPKGPIILLSWPSLFLFRAIAWLITCKSNLRAGRDCFYLFILAWPTLVARCANE